ncbi:DNA-directed RNA polymerase subunit H [Candidatus Woesearchaeota archaeon]|nr:DNA-directed RNA polymerase subunit H [Candidatus Woesearchaeota archaeon]
MKKKYDIRKHALVPEHVKLNDKEKEELLKMYHISLNELPKIKKNDPAISHLNVKNGDVIKIIRKSPTAGESIFYRGVINV